MTTTLAHEDWSTRTFPAELVQRYRDEGWWNGASLGSMIADQLAAAPQVRFDVRSDARPFHGSLGEVDRAARSLARSLQERGVGPGSVVLVQLPNWAEAAITFWAATYVGAVVVPVVHFYGPKEVGFILDDSRPSVIVTPDRFGRTDYLAQYEHLLGARDGAPLWLVVTDRPQADLPPAATAFCGLLDTEPLQTLTPVDPDAPAVVGFTSGTTLNPKGVVHSHHTIGWEARQCDLFYARGGPPQIVGSPVGHFMGMINAFLVPLLRHEPVSLIDAWNPATVLAWMAEGKLGVAGGPPYFLTSLLDHADFTSEHLSLIPYMGLGGATVPEAFTERATKTGIAVYRSYGSTEHPSATAGRLDDPDDKRLGTDGRALVGAEFRLDENGEILTRGADSFIGYTDPALTARAVDAEGWYRTGDLGAVDGDGYLTITGRIADVIIRGGENISAREIESLLLEMGPIAEVTVVAEPDPRLGEHAAAVIRLHDGAQPVALDDVRAHLAEAGLARQKWPESVHVVADFPRTATGKVQKYRVRDMVRDRSHHLAADPTEGDSVEPSGYVERPDYRVDVTRQRNLVTVTHNGVVLAESTAPLFVAEQDHGLVVYLPRADVRTDRLEPSAQTSRCPYKGQATYWQLPAAPEPIAWEYPEPYNEVAVLRDHLAFYQDRVSVQIGGTDRTTAPIDCACDLPS